MLPLLVFALRQVVREGLADVKRSKEQLESAILKGVNHADIKESLAGSERELEGNQKLLIKLDKDEVNKADWISINSGDSNETSMKSYDNSMNFWRIRELADLADLAELCICSFQTLWYLL